MKKILFSDMDGTIIENNHPIHSQDVEAVKKLRAAGHYFAFCTGRNLEEAKMACHHFEYDYMVLNNGAMIVDHQDRILKRKQIKNSDAKEILDYCLKYYPHMFYTFYDGHKTYGYCKGQTYVYQSNGPVISLNDDFLQALDNMKDDFDIFCVHHPDKSVEDILEIQQYIEIHYPNVQGTQNTHFLDITVSHCSKGTGLQDLCQILNQPLETYCIGDSFNDVSMFQVASHPYTFTRCLPDVVRHCQKQVSYVYEVIEDILK